MRGGEVEGVVSARRKDAPRSVCAWCGQALDTLLSENRLPNTSHGICVGCLDDWGIFPALHAPALRQLDLDGLPWGAIRVHRDGTVLDYNRAEELHTGRLRADVIGKDFFHEVAPCTAMTEFERYFREVLSEPGGARRFSFVFRFLDGRRLVDVSLLAETDSEVVTLLLDYL